MQMFWRSNKQPGLRAAGRGRRPGWRTAVKSGLRSPAVDSDRRWAAGQPLQRGSAWNACGAPASSPIRSWIRRARTSFPLAAEACVGRLGQPLRAFRAASMHRPAPARAERRAVAAARPSAGRSRQWPSPVSRHRRLRFEHLFQLRLPASGRGRSRRGAPGSKYQSSRKRATVSRTTVRGLSSPGKVRCCSSSTPADFRLLRPADGLSTGCAGGIEGRGRRSSNRQSSMVVEDGFLDAAGPARRGRPAVRRP